MNICLNVFVICIVLLVVVFLIVLLVVMVVLVVLFVIVVICDGIKDVYLIFGMQCVNYYVKINYVLVIVVEWCEMYFVWIVVLEIFYKVFLCNGMYGVLKLVQQCFLSGEVGYFQVLVNLNVVMMVVGDLNVLLVYIIVDLNDVLINKQQCKQGQGGWWQRCCCCFVIQVDVGFVGVVELWFVFVNVCVYKRRFLMIVFVVVFVIFVVLLLGVMIFGLSFVLVVCNVIGLLCCDGLVIVFGMGVGVLFFGSLVLVGLYMLL